MTSVPEPYFTANDPLSKLPRPKGASRAARKLSVAAVSWVLFTTALIILTRMMLQVTAVGGFCATGGPYVIAVECTSAIAWLVPTSIVSMLIAIGLYAALAGYWGPKLTFLFWSALFCTLGWAFLHSRNFERFDSTTAWVCGVMFLLMGGLPLLGLLRNRRYTVLWIFPELDAPGQREPKVRKQPSAAGSPEAQAAVQAFATRLKTGSQISGQARPAPPASDKNPTHPGQARPAMFGFLAGLVFLAGVLYASWNLAEWIITSVS